MSLSTLIEKCRDLEVYEQRYNSEDYKEFVFFSEDLPKWTNIIEQAFGPAKKPSGADPDPGQLQMTENYGSISKGQTLFTGEDNSSHVFLMLWPWEDKEHVTLKLAIY